MAVHSYKVSNMNCDGCVTNIRRALEDAEIQEFDIQLSKKLVTVTTEMDGEAVASLIKEAGYDAQPDSEKQGGFFNKLFKS